MSCPTRPNLKPVPAISPRRVTTALPCGICAPSAHPHPVSIGRTCLRIVLVLVAAENDDEDDPEAALPRVYSYNVTTP
jgi:hypothetical protein